MNGRVIFFGSTLEKPPHHPTRDRHQASNREQETPINKQCVPKAIFAIKCPRRQQCRYPRDEKDYSCQAHHERNEVWPGLLRWSANIHLPRSEPRCKRRRTPLPRHSPPRSQNSSKPSSPKQTISINASSTITGQVYQQGKVLAVTKPLALCSFQSFKSAL